MAATTITYSAAGNHRVSAPLLAYDQAAAVTFSGLPAGTGRFARVTDATGQLALCEAVAVSNNVASLNLNTTAVDAIFRGRVRGSIIALVTVTDAAGQVMAVEAMLRAAAKPGTPAPAEISGQYLTQAQVEALLADYEPDLGAPSANGQILASTTGKVRSWVTAGAGDVVGPASAVAGNLAALDATGKILADSGSKPADFAAAGDLSGHIATHPAPTNRDARNEAADAAIQSHITGTGSPHTAAGVGAAALAALTAAGSRYRASGAGAVAEQKCAVALGNAGAGAWAPALTAGAGHTVTRTGIWEGITPSGLEIGEGCHGRISGAYATTTTGVLPAFAGALDDIAAAVVDFILYRTAGGYYMACWEVPA
jgi:hypothetical protein